MQEDHLLSFSEEIEAAAEKRMMYGDESGSSKPTQQHPLQPTKVWTPATAVRPSQLSAPRHTGRPIPLAMAFSTTLDDDDSVFANTVRVMYIYAYVYYQSSLVFFPYLNILQNI